MQKKPNQLATLLDKQRHAKHRLPEDLMTTYMALLQITKELKAVLHNHLPNSILNSLKVVGFDDTKITLSVCSTTAANHIRYLQYDYLSLLREGSLTFAKLEKLNVIVSSQTIKSTAQYMNNHNSVVPSKSTSHHGFSKTTRQNITHVIEHVIKDKGLQKSLKKLVKIEK